MIDQTTPALPPISADTRNRIETAPRTAEAHFALLADLPAMNAVQLGGMASKSILPPQFTVVAWNVERCLFPEDSAAHLESIAPDIALLSEVDNGMARTGQRHTTEAFAAAMEMSYAFGIEFYELGLGGPSERHFCKDDFNTFGWHGNAILSAALFQRVAMVRLDEHGHWFAGPQVDADQPRLGGRMALLAELELETGPLTVVSTHLESNANAQHRHKQFEILLGRVDIND